MPTSPDPDHADLSRRFSAAEDAAPHEAVSGEARDDAAPHEAVSEETRGDAMAAPDPAASDPVLLDAVRREVVLDAPADRVWASLADADGLSGWLADEVELDVREGATGTVRDDGEAPREVTVEEVVPGRRLGLRWSDVDGRPSLVDLVLEPADADRTRVVVVEVPVAVLSLVAPAADRILVAAVAGDRPAGGGATASARVPALAGAR